VSAPLNGTQPFLPTAPIVPTLPSLNLSEDETRAVNTLAMRLFQTRPALELRGLYYDGLQKMHDLGISIPPSLAGLRTVMGWPQIGIDALDERCIVESFRYPGQTDADEELLDLWVGNNMPLESSLGILDALVYGRAYIIGGAGDSDDQPLMTVESPLNMTAVWDARLRKVTAAFQLYLNTDWSSDLYSREVAALYLPGKTVHMAREVSKDGIPTGNWEITERDNHGFEDPPVVRLANRQRTASREGASEITPAWMNLTDSGCRTLLGMEVGREFHAAPRRYVLGASEENFRKPDGTPISAWDTYVGKIWGLERDEEGNLPEVGQFAPSDPSVYTKLLDSYRQDFAAAAALPPNYVGIHSDGNPASADAIRASEARLVKRAERKMLGFGQDFTDALRMVLRIRNGGELDDKARRIACDWMDPATATPGATTDALQKQIAAGMVPPTSDVVLRKAGYTALERAQLTKDREDYEAEQALAQKAEMAHQENLAKAAGKAKAPSVDKPSADL
jgi:hypothetical protein